jgi:DNA-binding NtrC family response regulator
VLRLAEHFLGQFSSKYGRDVRRIDPAARDRLLAYRWPGNVRELSHVIERAVLWSRGPALEVEHLSLAEPSAEPGYRPPAPGDEAVAAPATGPESASGGPLPPAGVDLGQWERAMIEQALREAGGNQTRAAQRLGISRDTLRYRLKKFGIQG